MANGPPLPTFPKPPAEQDSNYWRIQWEKEPGTLSSSWKPSSLVRPSPKASAFNGASKLPQHQTAWYVTQDWTGLSDWETPEWCSLLTVWAAKRLSSSSLPNLGQRARTIGLCLGTQSWADKIQHWTDPNSSHPQASASPGAIETQDPCWLDLYPSQYHLWQAKAALSYESNSAVDSP